jgi:uridine phosphorylase
MTEKNRDAVKPLGVHTALGYLQGKDPSGKSRFATFPILDYNDGMIPPFIIAVGDRRRVWQAPKTLNFGSYLLVDEELRVSSGNGAGRVAITIGLFEKDGFSVPICVLETQMGCSATQINLKEALYYTREDGFVFDGKKIGSDGIYVIRAGTAAGVNSRKQSELELEIGDIAITTESYGSIGAVLQSIVKKIHFLSDMRDQIQALRAELMKNKILDISHDAETMRTMCSSTVCLQMQRAADSLGVRNFVGPNFSKDSLYGELGEDGFAALRDNYGIISTEMEQVAIDSLAGEFRAAGINVQTGLVSAIIGAIPGKSFPETKEEERAAHDAETNSVLIAAMTLHSIARKLNR